MLYQLRIDKIEGGGKRYNERCSNLELYRIIVMILIVAHHYVVCSGLTDANGPIYSNLMSGKSIFYLLFGAWGKSAINCFVLITGYFMCKSRITAEKFIKLIAEVMFYRLVIWMIFLLSGYEPFSISGFIKVILPVTKVQTNFTSCFLIFYFFIPFLNVLIHGIDKKKHLLLLFLCAFTYVLFGTLHQITMNYVSWFMVLYVIASYIRLYPKRWFDRTKLWGGLTVLSIFVSVLSIICCGRFFSLLNMDSVYSFVVDSNTFLAVSNGVCSFMFFKNLKVPQSNLINTIAASTFGVLLIHENSDTMRQWLWKDTLNNVGAYNTSYFALHAIGSVLLIFIICIVIDHLRILFLERPFLNLIKKWLKKNFLKG